MSLIPPDNRTAHRTVKILRRIIMRIAVAGEFARPVRPAILSDKRKRLLSDTLPLIFPPNIKRLYIDRSDGRKIQITYRLAVLDYQIYAAESVPNTQQIALSVFLVIVIVNSLIGIYAPICCAPYLMTKLGDNFCPVLICQNKLNSHLSIFLSTVRLYLTPSHSSKNSEM